MQHSSVPGTASHENGVRVSFQLPAAAAQRLRCVAQHSPHLLQALGVCEVRTDGVVSVSHSRACSSCVAAGPSTSSCTQQHSHYVPPALDRLCAEPSTSSTAAADVHPVVPRPAQVQQAPPTQQQQQQLQHQHLQPQQPQPHLQQQSVQQHQQLPQHQVPQQHQLQQQQQQQLHQQQHLHQQQQPHAPPQHYVQQQPPQQQQVQAYQNANYYDTSQGASYSGVYEQQQRAMHAVQHNMASSTQQQHDMHRHRHPQQQQQVQQPVVADSNGQSSNPVSGLQHMVTQASVAAESPLLVNLLRCSSNELPGSSGGVSAEQPGGAAAAVGHSEQLPDWTTNSRATPVQPSVCARVPTTSAAQPVAASTQSPSKQRQNRRRPNAAGGGSGRGRKQPAYDQVLLSSDLDKLPPPCALPPSMAASAAVQPTVAQHVQQHSSSLGSMQNGQSDMNKLDPIDLQQQYTFGSSTNADTPVHDEAASQTSRSDVRTPATADKLDDELSQIDDDVPCTANAVPGASEVSEQCEQHIADSIASVLKQTASPSFDVRAAAAVSYSNGPCEGSSPVISSLPSAMGVEPSSSSSTQGRSSTATHNLLHSSASARPNANTQSAHKAPPSVIAALNTPHTNGDPLLNGNEPRLQQRVLPNGVSGGVYPEAFTEHNVMKSQRLDMQNNGQHHAITAQQEASCEEHRIQLLKSSVQHRHPVSEQAGGERM